jgi:2-dehydro-3-deoxygalactonokinase
VQVFGAITAGRLAADALVCHPGTHAKWVLVSAGRIAAFRTMMTGELFALLGRHSILAAQLEAPVRPGPAFEAGVEEAMTGGQLLSGLFGIRARHLLGQGSADAASHASGLLIGTDVRAGLQMSDAPTVTLIGRPDLNELYAMAIARAGRSSEAVDGNQAFLAGIHQLTEML